MSLSGCAKFVNLGRRYVIRDEVEDDFYMPAKDMHASQCSLPTIEEPRDNHFNGGSQTMIRAAESDETSDLGKSNGQLYESVGDLSLAGNLSDSGHVSVASTVRTIEEIAEEDYERFWLRRYVSVMSLKDVGKKKSYSSTDALPRSRSFGGFLNSYPSNTFLADGDFYRPGMSSKLTPGLRKGWSFTRSAPKLPKVPRPQRALLIFDSVISGLRNTIDLKNEEITNLKDKDSFDASQYTKSSERLIKKLEFHLSKIEELKENYVIQQKLREGARNMAQAYVSSPHRTREQLNNVKSGFKECTNTMCAIEHTLEQMMGSLHFQMKGIAGFARLVSGDVFEITFRYGNQKWKSKGRVEKTKTQHWDCDRTTFKCLLGEILNIKAVEAKGLGKSVLLGTKNCETKDLFSAHPQIMTVNLNPSGSLKLNVIITWDPLDGACLESQTWTNVSASGVQLRTSPNRKRRPVTMALPPMQNGGSYSCYNGSFQRPFASVTEFPPLRESRSDHDSLSDIRPRFTQALFLDSVASRSAQRSVISQDSLMIPEPEPLPSLEQAVNSLSTALEDYQGQYAELNNLEQQVVALQEMLKKELGRRSRHSSGSSSISISVESALGCFDFLNDVDDDGAEKSRRRKSGSSSREQSLELSREASRSREPSQESGASHSSGEHTNLRKNQATTKTMDSGIESLGRHLSDDRGFSTGSSPLPASIGNEQIDQALLQHIMHCERLLNDLGAFGPLKCKEIHSLHNLEIQADVIEHLLELASSNADVTDLQKVLQGVQCSPKLVEFWEQCMEVTTLYQSISNVLTSLNKAYGTLILVNHGDVASKVFQQLLGKIVDLPVSALQRPDSIITLHQFLFYFKDRGKSDLDKIIVEHATDLSAIETIRYGSNDMIKVLVQKTFKKRLPSSDVMQVLATLLFRNQGDIRKLVGSYLKNVSGDPDARDKLLVTYVEALESSKPDTRQGACIALGILKATECIDQLTYVCQSDIAAEVKLAAKETLLMLGDEGRVAYEETQLTTHGFQGVMVTRM